MQHYGEHSFLDVGNVYKGYRNPAGTHQKLFTTIPLIREILQCFKKNHALLQKAAECQTLMHNTEVAKGS